MSPNSLTMVAAVRSFTPAHRLQGSDRWRMNRSLCAYFDLAFEPRCPLFDLFEGVEVLGENELLRGSVPCEPAEPLPIGPRPGFHALRWFDPQA
jgi:hypothetical protein